MTQPLIQRITGLTNAGTAVRVRLPRLMPGRLLRVSHLALDNASGEAVKALFVLNDLSGDAGILATDTVANGDGVGHLVDLLVGEETQLDVLVTGTADKGVVTLIVCGELYQPAPVVAVAVAAP